MKCETFDFAPYRNPLNKQPIADVDTLLTVAYLPTTPNSQKKAGLYRVDQRSILPAQRLTSCDKYNIIGKDARGKPKIKFTRDHCIQSISMPHKVKQSRATYLEKRRKAIEAATAAKAAKAAIIIDANYVIPDDINFDVPPKEENVPMSKELALAIFYSPLSNPDAAEKYNSNIYTVSRIRNNKNKYTKTLPIIDSKCRNQRLKQELFKNINQFA